MSKENALKARARELLDAELFALNCRLADSWATDGTMIDPRAALRAIEKALTRSPVCEDAREELVEAAANVADKHVQRARDAIAECKSWSSAQAEWSRARDLGLNIADEIRALAKAIPSQPESPE